ncbi:MAG: hypothetical protein KDB03_18280 [Planctomycetales bacterium]|nr:hypothetical protein [Planctomycetales bacterium]
MQTSILLSRYWVLACLTLLALLSKASFGQTEQLVGDDSSAVTFDAVQPIFERYCVSCHQTGDKEGDFSASSFNEIIRGTPKGKVIIPGSPDNSRLVRLITSKNDDKMPPEGEPAPAPDEIRSVLRWIETGAIGPMDQSDDPLALAPKIPAAPESKQHASSGCRLHGQHLAMGSFKTVKAINQRTGECIWQRDDLPGKVNQLRYEPRSRTLVVATGVVGVHGEIWLLDALTGDVKKILQGHTDAVYCACITNGGLWAASGSYDRQVVIWNVETGEPAFTLSGHNGAIYDLDFDPSGRLLATASADQTVKIWSRRDGQRLDTLGQPTGEVQCVRFHPNGSVLYAGSNDKQIRAWKIVSRDSPAINPMLATQFGHAGPVLALDFIGDGYVVTAATDRKVMLWSEALEPLGTVGTTDSIPVCIVGPSPGTMVLTCLALDGQPSDFSIQDLLPSAVNNLPERPPQSEVPDDVTLAVSSSDVSSPLSIEEREENNEPKNAQIIRVPCTLRGGIQSSADEDYFRFDAHAGESWIIEVVANQSDSPLDSFVEVLDTTGQPIPRLQLQATRQSYFTFRGKDSSTSDDFRLYNWEDMELDEYLYSSGEVTRLWMYPRGPDSGFKVYPGTGSRSTFFGTTPISHSLGESAYVVSPRRIGANYIPNGLPVFTLYYENDDDPLRRNGKDSRLTFQAPRTSSYYLKVRDARGFGGSEYEYTVNVRAPQPDFSITSTHQGMKVPLGSGREWEFSALRVDGLESEIEIEIRGLPEWIVATNPVTIEAGQNSALGAIFVTDGEAARQSLEAANDPIPLSLIARTRIEERVIERALEGDFSLALLPPEDLTIELVSSVTNLPISDLTISPGQTISARVVATRGSFTGPISLGKEDSGRNLPHGAYVDNIGLNGLLIVPDANGREFFITAAPKVSPQVRQFHLRSDTKGNPTSRPIQLHVEGNIEP